MTWLNRQTKSWHPEVVDRGGFHAIYVLIQFKEPKMCDNQAGSKASLNNIRNNKKWTDAGSNLGLAKKPWFLVIHHLDFSFYFGSSYDATNICSGHMSKASNPTKNVTFAPFDGWLSEYSVCTFKRNLHLLKYVQNRAKNYLLPKILHDLQCKAFVERKKISEMQIRWTMISNKKGNDACRIFLTFQMQNCLFYCWLLLVFSLQKYFFW